MWNPNPKKAAMARRQKKYNKVEEEVSVQVNRNQKGEQGKRSVATALKEPYKRQHSNIQQNHQTNQNVAPYKHSEVGCEKWRTE